MEYVDPAHLIELAGTDTKKSKEGKFPNQVGKIVTEVQGSFWKSNFEIHEEMDREKYRKTNGSIKSWKDLIR